MATIYSDVANHDPNGSCLRCGASEMPTLEVTTPCGRMQGFPLCAGCLFAAAATLDQSSSPLLRNGGKGQTKTRSKSSSRHPTPVGMSENAGGTGQEIPVASIA